MIIGIGADCAKIARIARLMDRYGAVFLARVFANLECKEGAPPTHYAKRFAAKEAAFKALGTGLRQGMTWHDIAVTNNSLGQPHLVFSGRVLEMLPPKYRAHLSLSDDGDMALAFVVLETD